MNCSNVISKDRNDNYNPHFVLSLFHTSLPRLRSSSLVLPQTLSLSLHVPAFYPCLRAALLLRRFRDTVAIVMSFIHGPQITLTPLFCTWALLPKVCESSLGIHVARSLCMLSRHELVCVDARVILILLPFVLNVVVGVLLHSVLVPSLMLMLLSRSWCPVCRVMCFMECVLWVVSVCCI